MKTKKQSLKLAVSFKENVRDLEIYNYVLNYKDTIGTSTFFKILVEKEMRERGVWTLED